MGINNDIIDFIYQIRLIGRFYVIFAAAMICWDKQDYLKLFRWLDMISILHFILTLLQIYVIKVERRDAVGGIFGVVYGYGNVAGHLLLVLWFIITLYHFFEKREKVMVSFAKILMIFILALNTEVKSFIFEAIIICVLMVMLQKEMKSRTIILLLLGVVVGFWQLDTMHELITLMFLIGMELRNIWALVMGIISMESEEQMGFKKYGKFASKRIQLNCYLDLDMPHLGRLIRK
jgi:hypothetical protein